MELIEWMNALVEKGGHFAIFGGGFVGKEWRVKLEISNEFGKMECNGKGKTFQEAVKDCLDKFEKVNSGRTRFDGPLIEYNPIDDETPF